MALLQVSTGGRTNSNKHSLETRQVAVAEEVQWAAPVTRPQQATPRTWSAPRFVLLRVCSFSDLCYPAFLLRPCTSQHSSQKTDFMLRLTRIHKDPQVVENEERASDKVKWERKLKEEEVWDGVTSSVVTLVKPFTCVSSFDPYNTFWGRSSRYSIFILREKNLFK